MLLVLGSMLCRAQGTGGVRDAVWDGSVCVSVTRCGTAQACREGPGDFIEGANNAGSSLISFANALPPGGGDAARAYREAIGYLKRASDIRFSLHSPDFGRPALGFAPHRHGCLRPDLSPANMNPQSPRTTS